MPPEIVALTEKPHLLMAVISVGILLGIAAERLAWQIRRRVWRRKNPRRWKDNVLPGNFDKARWLSVPEPAARKYLDAADQLRIVMDADFTTQPLLNKSEARLFRELDRIVIACNPGWQVMAQVSLGEVLRCENADAYGCINAKRVDLLLIDEDCEPRHAIEYQGGAHYQGSAAARDAVKKEALRRAGVGYHEVVSGQTTPSELRLLIEKLVDRPAAD